MNSVPITSDRGTSVHAELRELDGRAVSMFRLEGGRHRGSIGPADGATITRAVDLAISLRIPLVGVLATSGADIHEGVASLHAWGRTAAAISRASGVVPVLLGVDGPCISGPALLLGLADHVVMTEEAFAYVSGPDAVAEFTGLDVDPLRLGGTWVHEYESGLADIAATDADDMLAAIGEILSYLPDHTAAEPPALSSTDGAFDDPIDRSCEEALSLIPERANASYDVRDVINDVLDHDSFLELRPSYAPNMVTGYGRLGGAPVGVIANQPKQRAGTIDIEASRKAARFVQNCDSFNVPIVTFVDTPGFEPGKALEWNGMIRHGAELVHAYAAATVPRACIILRKAYGGAYIVMDSKGLGNDLCVAWPVAEIAVLGAAPAVQILFRRHLDAITDPAERDAERARLEAQYTLDYCTAHVAAERGLVDDVIDPRETRRVLARMLDGLRTKREIVPARRHANSPL